MKKNMNNKVLMFYGASPLIFERAQSLRENMTPSEEKLWGCLSNKQLGVKFRRQHPLSRFIVDFYCHEYLLVVEVDGGVHYTEEAKEYDEMRSCMINELGMKVIRFENEEVLKNVEKVVEEIKRNMV